MVARSIHAQSTRREEPFVEVNCAAIPEELIESELFGHVKGAFTGASENKKGKFRLADGGTLFLDEIGDMSLKTQAKVLRVLQEQTFEPVGGTATLRVDVRVVAATNKDLTVLIREGHFREDLYFRLNVLPLRVPPLRERREDIRILARHFLAEFAGHYGRRVPELAADAVEALEAYAWPGNVRELRNKSLRDARDRFEQWYIGRILERHGHNVTRTAEALGVERSHLHRKLKALGLAAPRGNAAARGPASGREGA
jgi:two-component system nitrogen regulation response regulator NtrX